MLLYLKKQAYRRVPNTAKIGKIHDISTPPIHLLFDLQQKNIPQKIPLFMRIYDFANENIVLSEKFEKSQFCCFDWSHIGVLYTKSLTLDRNP